MTKRIELPTWAFALIVIVELFTSNVIIFGTVFTDQTSYEILSVVSGPPRLIASIYVAYKLAGGELWRYYVLMDNLAALGILSIICYYYFTFGEEVTGLRVAAWINYLLIVLLFNGHYRVLMKKMKWDSQRVIIYKFIKIYYAALYIGLAARNTVNKSLGEFREIYLLFVITTSVYLSEFIFAMSTRDGTHHIEWHYQIGDEDHDQKETQGHGHGIEIN